MIKNDNISEWMAPTGPGAQHMNGPRARAQQGPRNESPRMGPTGPNKWTGLIIPIKPWDAKLHIRYFWNMSGQTKRSAEYLHFAKALFENKHCTNKRLCLFCLVLQARKANG